MTWAVLLKKLGNQPISITHHNHVTAVIDGKTYELTLQFEGGTPVLVPEKKKQVKQYSEVLWYEATMEVSEILGSGSSTLWFQTCKTEEEAFVVIRERGGNTIRRKVRTVDGNGEIHYYDFINNCWKNNKGEELPC